MLTRYGVPLLAWLDDEVLPAAAEVIEEFHEYVRAWRAVLGV